MSFNESNEFINNGNVDENASTQSTQNTQASEEPKDAPVADSSQQAEDVRIQTIYDATHGSDRATFRDENMKFTSSDQPGARLHFTPNQVESAREEMEKDLERRREEETTKVAAHQAELDRNNELNKDYRPLQPLSQNGQDFFANQNQVAEQAKRDAAHQAELDRNNELNRDFRPLQPLSQNGQDFFAAQEKAKADKAEEESKQQVEVDPLASIPQREMADFSKLEITGTTAIKEVSDEESTRRMILPFGEEVPGIRFGYNELKDALENRRLELSNGDIYVTYLSGQKDAEGNPISKTPLIFSKEQYDSLQKAIAHQEELDRNAKLNEGFTGPLSEKGQQALEDIDLISGDLRGKNFQESLSELMDEETAKRYMDFLRRDEEPGPEPTPEQTDIDKKLGEIDNKIGDIDAKLETMNRRLGEINSSIQDILQGQEAAQLTQEQLLEYIELLQEQSQIQIEITQSTAEKYRISMENTLNLILAKLGEGAPIEIQVTQTQTQNQEQAIQGGVPQQTPEQPEQEGEEEQNEEEDQEQSQQISAQQVQDQSQQQNQQQNGQVQSQQQNQSQTLQGGGTTPTPVNPNPPAIPTPVTVGGDRIAQLEDQLRELRGENTPEQRSAALGRELAALEAKLAAEGLTDAEKVRYFDILKQKETIDKELQIASQESEKKRKNKEKWIKIVAGVAGVGVALATPALGVAAVLGITLGGRAIGKGLQSWGNKLRTKSTAMKYEPRAGKTLTELAEMDKKQKRNQWWADRLGEAGAVLVGGATGYGIGTLFEGIVGKDFYIGMNKPVPDVPVIDGTSGTESGGTGTGGAESGGTGTGGAEAPISGPEVAPEPVLVQNGRINLPGSAWNGNLANGPAQDTLLGGAMNHSNYTGGVHEMAAYSLENDLVAAGISRSNLLANLETRQVHELLNEYVKAISTGNANPDLTSMLNSVKPGVFKALIGN